MQKSLYSEGRTDFKEAAFSRHNRTDTPKKSQKLYQQQEESTSWGWRNDSVGKVLAMQSRWHELRTQNSQKTRHSRKSIYNPRAAPLGDERHRQQKHREVDQQPVKMRNTMYQTRQTARTNREACSLVSTCHLWHQCFYFCLRISRLLDTIAYK